MTCKCNHPRERYTFTGRETHWGYVYLVYTLTANPRGRRKVGERHARWVR